MDLAMFKINCYMCILNTEKSLLEIHIKKLNISNPQKYIMKYK